MVIPLRPSVRFPAHRDWCIEVMILDRLTCLQREVFLKASLHLDERVVRPAAAAFHKFLADRSSNTSYISRVVRVSSRLFTRMVKIAHRSLIMGNYNSGEINEPKRQPVGEERGTRKDLAPCGVSFKSQGAD